MIIGLTGTSGAGKGTVVDYLVKEKGFRHFSARKFIVEEIKRRGLEVNRDTMTAVGNDLRAKHSPAYIIEELYRQAKELGSDAVIESIRTPGEVTALRGLDGFCLLAVDVDIKARYERIKARGSETDAISFEKFVDQENREMHSEDPNKQNLAACIKQADFIIENNGTVEELFAQADSVLNRRTVCA